MSIDETSEVFYAISQRDPATIEKYYALREEMTEELFKKLEEEEKKIAKAEYKFRDFMITF